MNFLDCKNASETIAWFNENTPDTDVKGRLVRTYESLLVCLRDAEDRGENYNFFTGTSTSESQETGAIVAGYYVCAEFGDESRKLLFVQKDDNEKIVDFQISEPDLDDSKVTFHHRQ